MDTNALKCRAWDDTRKEWIENGFCLRFDAYANCEVLNAFAEPYTPSRIVIPSFGVGVKDKHDKDIYSGDIVEYDAINVCGVVTWSNTRSGFIILCPNKPGVFALHNEWKVIGNIYEHSDLLQNSEVQL